MFKLTTIKERIFNLEIQCFSAYFSLKLGQKKLIQQKYSEKKKKSIPECSFAVTSPVLCTVSPPEKIQHAPRFSLAITNIKYENGVIQPCLL